MAVQRIGNELTIQNTSSGYFYQPAVTDLADGRFATAWADTTSGTSSDVRSQIVGSNPGAAFNVEGFSFRYGYAPALEQFKTTNEIVYAWTNFNFTTGEQRIFHAIISPEGVVRVNPLTPITHTNFSSSDYNPEVATLSDGSYVVGFDSTFAGADRDINAVRFDGNGNQMSFSLPFTSINDTAIQKDLAITALPGNHTVLVWSTNSPVNSNPNTYGTDVNGTFGLRASIFNADGTQFRDVQLVNTVGMTGNAGNGDQTEASVTALNNGNFVVTWTDTSLSKNDTSGSAIFARIFDANGIPTGDSFQVNTTTAGNQSDSDVTALSNGGFAVSWTDASGATTDIRARAFGANGSPTDTSDQVINTTIAGNQQNSQISGGTNNTFMVTWEDSSAAPNGTTGGQSVRLQLMSDGTTQEPPPPPPPQPPIQPQQPETSKIEFIGDNGPNNFLGNELDNLMFGYGGNDILNGAAGDDEIHGGNGRDRLTGGSGLDTFFFDTKPTSSNYDRIADFHHNEDTLALKGSIFRKLGASVSSGELRQGTEAHDSNDYLIYNRKNGKLYYDPDGNGDKDQVLIAQLTNKVKITASDFDII